MLAIGQPFGLSSTVTAGIVSAVHRVTGQGGANDRFIQTDAAINQGNSGGPMFDMNGNVIGINSQIYSQSGGNIGIGFAIPAEDAKPIIDRLMKGQKIERGYLGVQIGGPVTDDVAASLGIPKGQGEIIAKVEPNGPAAKAGLRAFDVLATDARGCTGTASYSIAVTAAPAVNAVAASGAGLCVNPAQPCVDVPFILTRGDSVGLRAVSVTFQLDVAKLQLCNPGPPSASVTLGTWASAFPNRVLQVTSLGNGRYTADVVLLGSNCGETGGGSLFQVQVAAVGPTGLAAITVESVVARDCANGPVAVAPGAAASLPIAGSAIVVSPETLPSGTSGTVYNHTLSASGGSGPLTFAVSAGSLPGGTPLCGRPGSRPPRDANQGLRS